MNISLAIVQAMALLTTEPVETRFVQVAPVPPSPTQFRRSPHHDRAVVLIHGLSIHPFSKRNVLRAKLQGWQEPGSTMVKTLAREADVYAFAYGQHVAVDRIASAFSLRLGLQRLRETGYAEIVLIGHSAGGLIARQLVEDYPTCGVTKVVQVCSPNKGSAWARAKIGVRQQQEPFLDSLTQAHRQRRNAERTTKRIPTEVEFVCLVCRLNSLGGLAEVSAAGWTGRVALLTNFGSDGLVALDSQWPEDLQAQGIPATTLVAGHFTVTRTRSGAEKVADLVRSRQPRWDEADVQAAMPTILGTRPPERVTNNYPNRTTPGANKFLKTPRKTWLRIR